MVDPKPDYKGHPSRNGCRVDGHAKRDLQALREKLCDWQIEREIGIAYIQRSPAVYR